MNEETRRKISQSMMGEKNPFYNKKHTPETKLKISLMSRKRKPKEIKCGRCGRTAFSKTWNKIYCAECKIIANREKNRRAEAKRKGNPNRRKSLNEQRNKRRKDPSYKMREKIYNKILSKTEKGRAKRKRNNLQRYARIKRIVHAFTDAQWQEKVKAAHGICPHCKNQFTKEKLSLHELTMDHTPAVSQVQEGYAYTIDQVSPLCRSCNSRKNKWILKEF